MTERPSALDVVAGVELAGTTCVITGATAGLGRESARALATAGARVIMTGRSRPALDAARAWVQERAPGADLVTVELNLAALASVRAGAARIRAETNAIHVLMANAGVMFTPFGTTADGFELQFGTNHVGHFALVTLLAPQLAAANGSRVVILTSGGHVMGDVDLDDPNWQRRDYDKFVAYGASKTANILFMVELDRRLRDAGVRALAVNPGAVATSLARHMSREDFSALRSYAANSRSGDGFIDFTMPEQGAATQVWAAVSEQLDGLGSVYLEDCSVSNDVAPYAIDEERAARLWTLSESLV
jgi:NAD(P)-dependent dehydrogenase (short-subunit alcohol dehydrogenase family)